jgi:hypothetical protein
MTAHDMTAHDMTAHDMTAHDMTAHDMTAHDMTGVLQHRSEPMRGKGSCLARRPPTGRFHKLCRLLSAHMHEQEAKRTHEQSASAGAALWV